MCNTRNEYRFAADVLHILFGEVNRIDVIHVISKGYKIEHDVVGK